MSRTLRSSDPRGTNSDPLSTWHGLVAVLKNGEKILEKNNYWCTKAKKVQATNWAEIDKSKVQALQLYWKGKLTAEIRDTLNPEEWYFSHTGSLVIAAGSKSSEVQVVSRNIGYKKAGILYITRVVEETGKVEYTVEHPKK